MRIIPPIMKINSLFRRFTTSNLLFTISQVLFSPFLLFEQLVPVFDFHVLVFKSTRTNQYLLTAKIRTLGLNLWEVEQIMIKVISKVLKAFHYLLQGYEEVDRIVIYTSLRLLLLHYNPEAISNTLHLSPQIFILSLCFPFLSRSSQTNLFFFATQTFLRIYSKLDRYRF